MLDQYPAVLQAVEQMSNLNLSDSQYQAKTDKTYFLQGCTHLAAKIA